jgi:hypothetical protein
MRLMYQSLRSENASVAIEMVETSIRGQNLPYLLPLIDDLPLDEKIEKGRKLFNLVSRDEPERLLTFLSQSGDPVTRMLSLYVISDLMPNEAFIPVIESLLQDEDVFVRQVAEFAYTRETNKEGKMPEIIEMINKLKTFALFEGLGTRELHALASITREQEFKPQDIVIRAGEENHSIYLVLSGRITTFHDYGMPDQKELRISEAVGYLNFIPAFLHQPALNTSVATEATEVLVLPQSQFHEIMRIYPQIGLNLLGLAAKLLRSMGVTA